MDIGEIYDIEINKAINNLKRKKAKDIDNIPGEAWLYGDN